MNLENFIGKTAKFTESPNLCAIVKIENIFLDKEKNYVNIILSTIKGFNVKRDNWNIGSLIENLIFTNEKIKIIYYLDWELTIIEDLIDKCSKKECGEEAVKFLELDFIFNWEIPVCKKCFEDYYIEMGILNAEQKQSFREF